MTGQNVMTNDFYVYLHIRNDTGEVFYVGKGRKKRATRTDGRNDYWKRIVQKSGGFSVKYVFSNLTESEAFDLEIKTIQELKNQGVNLCNLTDGGEGLSGIVPTKDHREKISLAKAGIKRPIDVVQRSAEARRKKMIGKKFGRLTVVEQDGERKAGRHPRWVCKCDCGNVVTRSAPALRQGREPSCGCAARDFQRQKYDLTGKKFGRLLVVKAESASNSKRNIVWKCLCDCGNETVSVGSDLRRGHKKSCGCLHSDVIRQINKQRGSNE